MNKGQVTVMVPSYNYRQYLAECVESAATQEGVDVEVALVDNGSTDGSVDLAHELAERFDNVRLVVHPDNGGIITSFNRCRDEVRGEFAVLLCADDALVPGSLARSVAVMREHPNVGLVYGTIVDFLDRADVRPEQLAGPEVPPKLYDGKRWLTTRCRRGTNPIRTPEVLMRQSVLEVAGKLDTELPFTSDLNMWLRMAATADVAFVPGAPLALYRQHPDNFGASYLRGKTPLYDIEQRWRAYDKFFAWLPPGADRDRWHRLASRSLASEARYHATRAYVKLDDDVRDAHVAELLDFADALDPDGTSPVEALGWRLRRSLGPQRSQRFPLLLPRPMARRVHREYFERRRVAKGI